jgi:hypothetical protein
MRDGLVDEEEGYRRFGGYLPADVTAENLYLNTER